MTYFPQTTGLSYANPALYLFGNRFFIDQTPEELLIEFLLICSSPKKVGNTQLDDCEVFPDIKMLRDWPENEILTYQPELKINLKLFAFLTSSKLEGRHKSHIDKFKELSNALDQMITTARGVSKENTKNALINLLFGFQGTKNNRTWCAQTFTPICKEFLAYESIWPKAQEDLTWDEALRKFNTSKHTFMARGGEVIFLQICAALSQPKEAIIEWLISKNLERMKRYADTELLREELCVGLTSVLNKFSDSVGKLANFIDNNLCSDTNNYFRSNFNPRSTNYCNSDSWQEGFLFAVELLRICKANIDPIDKIDLLSTGFALHVLRSISAQSNRVIKKNKDYYWVLSPIDCNNNLLKTVSKHSYQLNERMISNALRSNDLIEKCKPNVPAKKTLEESLNEADDKYGHKLFRALGKKIGLVYPKTGTGTRFVLSDRLLRFLVLTTIEPGQKITADTFTVLLKEHYNILFNGQGLKKAREWIGLTNTVSQDEDAADWVWKMLKASGMLIHLSDSCSLIKNPFSEEGNQK